jgi:hypothetical protein
MHYPYINFDEQLDTIQEIIKNTKEYKLEFVYDVPFIPIRDIINKKLINGKYNNRYTLIIRNGLDYRLYNKITDIFIEKCNVLCRFGKSKTRLELVKDKKFMTELIHQILKDNKEITPKNISNYLYKNTTICSYFPMNIAYGIYKHFNVKSVLDISAGWGDRLIAACIADIKYYSADPNSCNEQYYNKMIEYLGDKNKQKVQICGFENLIITENYDMILTSPPYFDLEKYSEDKDQSHIRYKNSNNWLYKFLFVVLKKAWNHLNDDGHMILYLNDYYKFNYCEKTVNFCIKELNKCSFLGVIGLKTNEHNNEKFLKEKIKYTTSLQPLWIFHKS